MPSHSTRDSVGERKKGVANQNGQPPPKARRAVAKRLTDPRLELVDLLPVA
jgi:hypothetical protein